MMGAARSIRHRLKQDVARRRSKTILDTTVSLFPEGDELFGQTSESWSGNQGSFAAAEGTLGEFTVRLEVKVTDLDLEVSGSSPACEEIANLVAKVAERILDAPSLEIDVPVFPPPGVRRIRLPTGGVGGGFEPLDIVALVEVRDALRDLDARLDAFGKGGLGGGFPGGEIGR